MLLSNLNFHTLLLLTFILGACSSEKPKEVSKAPASGLPVLVGPNDFNSTFSYYSTSPESPDGSKIAYVKILEETKENRSEEVPTEIWTCNSDLTNHQKVTSTSPIEVHNGARVQWLDNQSIAYQDDSIRVVNLNGEPLMKAVVGRIGHHTHNGKILYSANAEETNISTTYEYDVNTQQRRRLNDVMDFTDLVNHFDTTEFREPEKWRILHLQYSPDGSKISFRMDVGPHKERFNHLVIMDINGENVHYFGPKPMHFLWYDNESILGHDNQIDDELPNDKSLRRWDLDGNLIETLAGPGNHTGASQDRQIFGSESWYSKSPIIISVFNKGQTTPFWQDTASTDKHTTWTLAYHTNASFSRDGKRVYYNKCVAPGKVRGYMAVLPEK